jgi:hypothetical protein
VFARRATLTVVHREAVIREVFRLRADHGWGSPRLAAETGVSATQVRRWLHRDLDSVLDSPMRRHRRCDGAVCRLRRGLDEAAYAYLLGQYLGDGTIVAVSRSQRLEISTTAGWPGVRDEVTASITTVLGRPPRVGAERRGAVAVSSYSVHWPCLFPQHGPGRKHSRLIELTTWQAELALAREPGRLLRGLIHSDGWRGSNRVTTRGRAYEYPRYMFFNMSDDILGIFCLACDALGVEWRASGQHAISVARRRSVALLDEHIGPKY